MLPELTDAQLSKLSDIASETALISLASVVLPAVLDKTDFARVVVGLVATIVLWLVSLWILKIKE